VFVATLSLLGLTTYALYPAAPPWMASAAHLTSPIVRVVPAVVASLHTQSAGSLFEHGYAYANNVAAVPSLHTAFALLIAITLWPVVPRRLRALLAVYPLLMGFTLVYTGEHYVFDLLLGWLYTVVAVVAGRALMRSWTARRAVASPQAGEPAYAAEPTARS
jgi:membrane-associated phospholipid phosphatase